MPNIRPVLFLVPALLTLNACSTFGIVTGTAATAGVAASQEGGIRGAISDTAIKAKINDAWFKYDLETFAKLSTTVDQGRVLITGVVQDPEDRVEAIRLAWQVDGVKQVINEVQVADSDGLPGYVRDAWISTRLRTAITLDRDIESLNYSIDTVKGIVYLMGVAENQVELNKVIEIARTVPNVKQVVSYVKMAGEPIEGNNTAINPMEMNDGSGDTTGTSGSSMTPIPLSEETSTSGASVTRVESERLN